MSYFNGQHVRHWREARKLSRERFAVEIGKSVPLVTKLERNECRPSIATLGRMARVLGVSVNAFFDDDLTDPDLLGEHDPRPSELGAYSDERVKKTLDTWPPLSDEQARRISAIMFPAPKEGAR